MTDERQNQQELGAFLNQAVAHTIADYNDLRAHHALQLPLYGTGESARRYTGSARDEYGPTQVQVQNMYRQIMARLEQVLKLRAIYAAQEKRLSAAEAKLMIQSDLEEHADLLNGGDHVA